MQNDSESSEDELDTKNLVEKLGNLMKGKSPLPRIIRPPERRKSNKNKRRSTRSSYGSVNDSPRTLIKKVLLEKSGRRSSGVPREIIKPKKIKKTGDDDNNNEQSDSTQSMESTDESSNSSVELESISEVLEQQTPAKPQKTGADKKKQFRFSLGKDKDDVSENSSDTDCAFHVESESPKRKSTDRLLSPSKKDAITSSRNRPNSSKNYRRLSQPDSQSSEEQSPETSKTAQISKLTKSSQGARTSDIRSFFDLKSVSRTPKTIEFSDNSSNKESEENEIREGSVSPLKISERSKQSSRITVQSLSTDCEESEKIDDDFVLSADKSKILQNRNSMAMTSSRTGRSSFARNSPSSSARRNQSSLAGNSLARTNRSSLAGKSVTSSSRKNRSSITGSSIASPSRNNRNSIAGSNASSGKKNQSSIAGSSSASSVKKNRSSLARNRSSSFSKKNHQSFINKESDNGENSRECIIPPKKLGSSNRGCRIILSSSDSEESDALISKERKTFLQPDRNSVPGSSVSSKRSSLARNSQSSLASNNCSASRSSSDADDEHRNTDELVSPPRNIGNRNMIRNSTSSQTELDGNIVLLTSKNQTFDHSRRNSASGSEAKESLNKPTTKKDEGLYKELLKSATKKNRTPAKKQTILHSSPQVNSGILAPFDIPESEISSIRVATPMPKLRMDVERSSTRMSASKTSPRNEGARPRTSRLDVSDHSAAAAAVIRPKKSKRKHRRSDSSEDDSNEELKMPESLLRSLFQEFAEMPVNSEVYPVIHEITEKFWKQVADNISAFAEHAGRDHIDRSDVELYMYRQGLFKDRNSLNALIEKYLPYELRRELIPMTVANVVEDDEDGF